MSVLTARLLDGAGRARAARELDKASFRVRMVKVICGIALGVCFWYSVPYAVPIEKTNGIEKSASALAENYGGSTSREVAMPIITAVSAFMMWRLARRGRFGGRLMLVSLVYIGWAVISVVWSEAPAITEKRLVVFVMDAFFAFVVARTLSMVEIALLGFVSTGVVAVISLYVDVVQQQIFAPFDSAYRFMGVMEPNSQAMNLVVCLLCALTLMQHKPKLIAWLWPAVVFIATLLLLTRARVSTIICLAMAVGISVRAARRRFRSYTLAMVLVAVLAVAAPLLVLAIGTGGAAQTLFMMGRNDSENTASLSNRAPLWSELMESVRLHPWLGFGYEAFWTPARVENISLDQGWDVPHAHNTFLDEMLSMGVVGTVLFAIVLGGACMTAWKRHMREGTAESLLPALLITWLALESVTESVPLDPFLPTMLAYACIAKMCMVQGSDAEADSGRLQGEIVSGVPRLGDETAW